MMIDHFVILGMFIRVGMFLILFIFFFFNVTATTEIYTLSLHDALPILGLQTVANQFLTMEPLEYGVANSCKSVSNHGTIGTWGCKQLQVSL